MNPAEGGIIYLNEGLLKACFQKGLNENK